MEGMTLALFISSVTPSIVNDGLGPLYMVIYGLFILIYMDLSFSLCEAQNLCPRFTTHPSFSPLPAPSTLSPSYLPSSPETFLRLYLQIYQLNLL